MKYLETLRFGCDDENDDIAEVGAAEVARMDLSRMYSHATIIASLAPIFNRAQLLWQEGAVVMPYHLAIIFTDELDHKRKEEDTETVYERIKWFIKTFKVPDCGMVISFYQNLEGKNYIMDPWHVHHVWPFREQCSPHGRYITVQKVGIKGVGGVKKEKVMTEAPIYISHVEKLAARYGYDIKYVDYSMPWEEIYQLMLHADHHFTYIGSTYYLAACIGTPTTAFSYSVSENKNKLIHGSYYDYDTGERISVTMPETRWGIVGLNRTRTIQFDFEKNAVINKPVNYVREISSIDSLDAVFENQILKL